MTRHQSRKLLALTAIAVVTSLAMTSSAYAISKSNGSYPTVPYIGGVPVKGPGSLREWQDQSVYSEKLRQQMLLPSRGEKVAEASGEAIRNDGFKEWQDETVKNNSMRNRMSLPQQ